jgi:hypothetical protein
LTITFYNLLKIKSEITLIQRLRALLWDLLLTMGVGSNPYWAMRDLGRLKRGMPHDEAREALIDRTFSRSSHTLEKLLEQVPSWNPETTMVEEYYPVWTHILNTFSLHVAPGLIWQTMNDLEEFWDNKPEAQKEDEMVELVTDEGNWVRDQREVLQPPVQRWVDEVNQLDIALLDQGIVDLLLSDTSSSDGEASSLESEGDVI